MRYKTKGVCSQEITFDVQDNKLTNVQFVEAAQATPRAWPVWWREWKWMSHPPPGRHPMRPPPHLLSRSAGSGVKQFKGIGE